MVQIRFLDEAIEDLRRLDKAVGQRILKRIRWLASNFDMVIPEPLKGDLSGLHKLRAGDYRVLYQIIDKEQLLLIHQIGHRRDIYRP
jgi:mRNA interferase RelE/StbE